MKPEELKSTYVNTERFRKKKKKRSAVFFCLYQGMQFLPRTQNRKYIETLTAFPAYIRKRNDQCNNVNYEWRNP